MLNLEEMSFDDFIAFGEEQTGQKVDGPVKEVLRIMFDNLKSGEWSEDDLRNITNALKANRLQRNKRSA